MKNPKPLYAACAVLLMAVLVAGCTDEKKKETGKLESPVEMDMDHFWYRVRMDSPEQGVMTMEYMVDKPRLRVELDVQKGGQKGGIRLLADGEYLYLLNEDSRTALRYEYSEEMVRSLIPETLSFSPSFDTYKQGTKTEPVKLGEEMLEGTRVVKYELDPSDSPERTVLYVTSENAIRRTEVFRKEAGKLFSLDVEMLDTSPDFPEDAFSLPEHYEVKTTDLPELP
ncbi:MAG: hypothetical protein R6V10_03420 [bacterium]